MDQDELDALVAAAKAKAMPQPPAASPTPSLSLGYAPPSPDDDELSHMVAAARAKEQSSTPPTTEPLVMPGDAPPLTVAAHPPVPNTGLLANDPADTTAASVAKNVATGAVKGVGDIGGFVGNTGNLADYLVSRADHAITGKPVDQNMAEIAASRQPQPGDSWLHSLVKATDPRNLFPSGADLSNKAFGYTGQYVPTTPTERAVQGGIEAAVGTAAPGVRGAPSGASPGFLPTMADVLRGIPAAAAAGGAGTAVSEATGDPLMAAALMGTPAVAYRGGNAMANALMGRVEPATAQLAQTARQQFGIPITAPQISESPALRFTGSVLNKMPMSGAGANTEAQQTAFNRAVAGTFGEDADLVTPQVMRNARTRIGNEFDRVANATTIQPDHQFVGDLRQTMSDASRVLPEPEIRPLAAQLQNIGDVIRQNNGVIPGASYQALTRTGSPLNRAINSSDPNVKFYAGRIKDALDDTMRRSATPEDAQALTTAKLQYKNMKTVEDLVEKSPTGNISPPLLMGQVRNSYGNMAYAGGGDIGDLARIGQRFMKEPPSSGTAERSSVMNTLAKAGGLGAAAMGMNSAYQAASPVAALGGLAGIPASLLAGRAVGGALRSNTLADALIGRSLGTPVPSRTQDLANALMFPYLPQVTPRSQITK